MPYTVDQLIAALAAMAAQAEPFDDGVGQATIVEAVPSWTGCMACGWGPAPIEEWDAHAASTEHEVASRNWQHKHDDDRYYTFNDAQGMEVRRA